MSTATLLAAEIPGWFGAGLAILTAVGGGLFGAWLTTWKDLEQQRREIAQQARARMLEAADAFIGAAAAAIAQLRPLDQSMHAHEQFFGRWERLTLGRATTESGDAAEGLTTDVARGVNESLAAAVRQLRRVELIFGPASGNLATSAVDAANQAVERIRSACAAVYGYYAVLRVSESESLARRREVVDGYSKAASAIGGAIVPGLADALDDLAGRVAGTVVNVKGPLEDALSEMTKAIAEAEAAIATFSRDASLALLAPPIESDYEVVYVVGTDEMIRPMVVRKKGRLSRALARLRG